MFEEKLITYDRFDVIQKMFITYIPFKLGLLQENKDFPTPLE